jgi:hypothetical protein
MTSGGGSRDGGAKFGVQEGASLRLDEEREEESVVVGCGQLQIVFGELET